MNRYGHYQDFTFPLGHQSPEKCGKNE